MLNMVSIEDVRQCIKEKMADNHIKGNAINHQWNTSAIKPMEYKLKKASLDAEMSAYREVMEALNGLKITTGE